MLARRLPIGSPLLHRVLGCGLILVVGWTAIDDAHAGLTASEVVVVINGDSFNSRTLANHFVGLRGIPANNVIVLRGIPSSETINVDEFRAKILRPLLAEIEQRKLSGHIQCISYSADFPTAIDISSDLTALGEIPQVYTRQASINALTYFYARVLEPSPAYIQLDANFYARRTIADYFRNPGGDETLEAWQRIERLMTEQQHADAAQKLEELLKQQPHQFPMAYLAAAQTALAGDGDRAVSLLQLAVNNGWNAGGYLAKDERFDSLRKRSDFQVLELSLDAELVEYQPTIGFDARVAWTPNGIPVRQPQLGMRFLLSTVLGITRGSGSTLNDALEALKRSAEADFTHPKGKFLFSVTNDVRSTTRKWGFLPAVDELEKLGFDAQLITTPLPMGEESILGLQTGTPNFAWAQTRSQFAAGAIADNLTSFGGVMTPNSQTKLTEFIKAGAAGSSGTVTEPFAIQEKFPTSQLYVHYARGVSLAEAFYMSVSGPYQLLIVGDPLCRPFSHAPKVAVDTTLRSLDEPQLLRLELKPEGLPYAAWSALDEPLARREPGLAPAFVAMRFDGIGTQLSTIRRSVTVNLAGQTSGYHEVTLQFIADDPLAQRSQQTIPVWIGPADAVELQVPDLETKISQHDSRQFSIASLQKEKLNVLLRAKQAKRLTLWNQHEQIAVAEGNQADLQVELSGLGRGPVRLQARAELEDGSFILSLPHWIRVDP